MNSKRKSLISMLAIVFVLLAVVATIAIAFALTQQTITTTLNIGYVVEDIDGTASATYTIGGVTESLTAKKGDQVIGDTLVFHAGDTEDAGNLMFPEGQIPLSATNDNIVIQYTYSNTGAKHYIASMSFDSELVADNMKVEYSINGTDYSTNRYAVVVPANTSNKSYWIKISIENKAKSASFTGDFKWLLSGCDEQSKEYLSLTSLEFLGSNGSYSASVATAGDYVGELVFPSLVNGDPVTTIVQNSSLSSTYKQQVTGVYIPYTVQTIKQYAFRDYSKLQTVTFEQNEIVSSVGVQNETGLTLIDQYAFYSCRSLNSIIIPNSVTSIGIGAFKYCVKLPSITIPDSVISIGKESFAICSELISVTIGSGLTTIGDYPFYACKNLTNIDVVGNQIFHSQNNCIIKTETKTLIAGCKTSTIPTDGSVTIIGQDAFWNHTGLTEMVIPDSVVTIGSCAFQQTGLKSVTIGSGVTKIELGAFLGCTSLTEIVIPDNVTSLSNYAFENCTNLKNIKIGKGLTILGASESSSGYDVFISCSNLESIEVSPENKVYQSVDNCLIRKDTKTLIRGCKNSIIPTDGTVEIIGREAFNTCKGLEEIIIPNNILNIGRSAFSDCENLTKIVLPENLTRIEQETFYNCKKLNQINLPQTLTTIGEKAFNLCSSLPEIVIPNNVTTIGKNAFASCKAATKLIIGNGVTNIGIQAFYQCTSLTEIVIPDSVNCIAGSAFVYCLGVTSITFENSTGWVIAASSTATTGTQVDVTSANTNLISMFIQNGQYYSKYWLRIS